MTDEQFLRGIAERPADDLPRMVYADWLEEQGNAPRAEFIRVQCELAGPKLAKARAKALKLRERELLDAHRREWIAALRVPVEDVQFERGLISAVRLPKWESFADPHFAAVAELDLSGTGMGDVGVADFAERANFSTLKKLMLDGNGITNTGASALGKAKGLPTLDTLYLFDNPITDVGLVALKKRKLYSLDIGDHMEGYEFTSGQTDAARRRLIREHLHPALNGYFEKYPLLQSAMLLVAQYWNDEADDAVHAELIFSELPEPVLEGALSESNLDSDEGVPGADPNVLNTVIEREYDLKGGSVVSTWQLLPWDHNGGAIPLWAAFAPEGGHQEYEFVSEVYAPAVLFYRHGGYEFLPMLRPQLDGILPEWRTGG